VPHPGIVLLPASGESEIKKRRSRKERESEEERRKKKKMLDPLRPSKKRERLFLAVPVAGREKGGRGGGMVQFFSELKKKRGRGGTW